MISTVILTLLFFCATTWPIKTAAKNVYVLFILAAPVDKSTTSTIKILFWPTCAFVLEASEIAMQHHAVIILFFFNKALFAECTQLGYVSSCGYVRAVTAIWCVENIYYITYNLQCSETGHLHLSHSRGSVDSQWTTSRDQLPEPVLRSLPVLWSGISGQGHWPNN